MFIVFEGIDGCGKTTISKAIAEKLGWVWTKEPVFGTEKADILNKLKHSAYTREAFFMIDRAFHQRQLRDCINVICDRYIWTGLAYALTFGKEAYEMASSIYTMPEFLKPDLYIFIDSEPMLCHSRRQDFTIDVLENLRNNFFSIRSTIEKDSTIAMIPNNGSLDSAIKECYDFIKEFK